MEQIEPKIISALSASFEIDLRSKTSINEIQAALADHINDLIIHDFNKLVQILYRIDVSEKLLKKNLQESKKNAGAIMAEMIIQRQIEKLKTRRFKSNDDIAEGEKW